jgi:hypothetical protein
MVMVRKELAGSCSGGYVWPEDGAVIEVADIALAQQLFEIPNGGFSEVIPFAAPDDITEADLELAEPPGEPSGDAGEGDPDEKPAKAPKGSKTAK